MTKNTKSKPTADDDGEKVEEVDWKLNLNLKLLHSAARGEKKGSFWGQGNQDQYDLV